MLAIYWCNNFFPAQIKIMRTLRVNLFKDHAWLRSFLDISFIRKGNRANQFSTDVTFYMNICRSVQFWIINNENKCHAVQYLLVFHDIHRFEKIFSLKFYPNNLSLTSLRIKWSCGVHVHMFILCMCISIHQCFTSLDYLHVLTIKWCLSKLWHQKETESRRIWLLQILKQLSTTT